jgi:hypothetical protein
VTRWTALLLAGVAVCGGRARPEEQGVITGGPRVTVEVLNASGARGLARAGSRHLRERGLDVVSYGTAERESDSTLVLVRRGDVEAGQRVLRALRTGTMHLEPDTLRRVDVTVLLGRDYALPPGVRP